MDLIEIIVIILAASLAIFTIVFNIIMRKKGKSCCGSCSSCGMNCPSKNKKEQKTKNEN